jgi:hypothetical protein
MASQDIINLQNLCSPHCLVPHFLLADHIQQLDQDYPQTCGTPGTLHTVHAMYVRSQIYIVMKNTDEHTDVRFLLI